MKKIIQSVLAIVLMIIALGSFSQTTYARSMDGYSYVHTLRTAKLFAKGEQLPKEHWYPEFNFADVTDRALSGNSDWYTDQIVDGAKEGNTIPGYFRVATNELVRDNDVVLVNKNKQPFSMQTHQDYQIFNFDAKSYKMNKANKTLPAGNWSIGTLMTFPMETSYFQVGGNEWVQITE